MMDVFVEELVKKKKDAKDYIILAVLILCAIVLSVVLLIATMTISVMLGQLGQIAGSIGTLLVAGVWFCVYKIFTSRSIEYEYVVINSSLDIDKIMSKKRRKSVVSLDIKDVSIMACVDDDENNSVYKNHGQNVKVVDLSAKNPNMYTYFIDCNIEGKRQIILFQPTSKMVESLWKFNPKAVRKYNI